MYFRYKKTPKTTEMEVKLGLGLVELLMALFKIGQ